MIDGSSSKVLNWYVRAVCGKREGKRVNKIGSQLEAKEKGGGGSALRWLFGG
jgi:hypothetical protein